MQDGTVRYAWDVPPRSWTEGTNELLLELTAEGPSPSAVVRRVAVDFGT
jgi:hypothetical protein